MIMPLDQTLPVLGNRNWFGLGLGRSLQEGLTRQLGHLKAEGERGEG
jgi:hypothetical protein